MAEIRPLAPEDWPRVHAIYAAGIATGDATFETEPPSWEEFDAGRLPGHRLVAVEGGDVVGWAALSPTSHRTCYAGVVEHSVYVDELARGRGIGRALMDALVAGADSAGIWTIQTSVFPENAASVLSTSGVGSGSSAAASGSHSSTASGATHCSSSAARRACVSPAASASAGANDVQRERVVQDGGPPRT